MWELCCTAAHSLRSVPHAFDPWACLSLCWLPAAELRCSVGLSCEERVDCCHVRSHSQPLQRRQGAQSIMCVSPGVTLM